MKIATMVFYLFPLSLLALSCSEGQSNEDPVDSAMAINKVTNPVQKDAARFAVRAAEGGMLEEALGRLAQEKAWNPRVKEFGAMMVKDHSEATENLRHISTAMQIALPDSLGEHERKEVEDLSKKSGKDFDKAYMDMMVDDHKTDVAEFRAAADKCSDSTLKSFAYVTLPTLEKHLDSAKAITGKQ